MRSERGDSKLGCIIYIVAALYVVYLAFILVPMFYSNLELKNEMSQVASSYSSFHGQNARAVDVVYTKAQQLELPVQKRDIRIRRVGKSIEITVTYKRSVNYLFMKKDLQFKPSVNKPVYGIVR